LAHIVGYIVAVDYVHVIMAQNYCVVTAEVQFVQLSPVILSVCVWRYCTVMHYFFQKRLWQVLELLHCCWIVCKCMYKIGFSCSIQK